MSNKVLVLGATGAMGTYLVPELLGLGYSVDAVTLEEKSSENTMLRYIKTNAMDDDVLSELLKNKYDAIVDFMLYETKEFEKRFDMLLSNTKHYIFLSSYRVYADKDEIITESSPRLLDVDHDPEHLASEDYAIIKARQENIVRGSKYKNWTIIRPAITYSTRRFQLVSCEANVVVRRALEGKTVIMPEEAKNVQATMTWGGDVAKMIARLVLNEKAYCETYTTSTSEHNPWSYIAKIYEETIGLKIKWVDTETFLKIRSGGNGDKIDNTWKWNLCYDRLYNRRVDNAKVLEVTGLKQSDLTPISIALPRELKEIPKNEIWPDSNGVYELMDKYLEQNND